MLLEQPVSALAVLAVRGSLRGTRKRLCSEYSVPAMFALLVACYCSLLAGAASGQCARSQQAASCVVVCSFSENNQPDVTLSADIGVPMGLNRTGRTTVFSLRQENYFLPGFGLDLSSITGRLVANSSVDYEAVGSRQPSAVIVANQTAAGSSGAPADSHQVLECLLNINVTNVNEAPYFADRYTVSVPENSPTGTPVLQVSATDPDRDALVYSLVSHTSYPALAPSLDSDDQLGVFAFSVDPKNGSIRVRNQTALDYEHLSAYTMFVVATDGVPPLAVVRVDIDVVDRNEFPPMVQLLDPYLQVFKAVHTIAEGTYSQPLDLGYFEIYDVESNPMFNMSVQGGEGKVQLNFFLDGASRPVGVARVYKLSTVAGVQFDRELQSSYALRIVGRDDQLPASLTAETNFTLTITDVDDSSPLFPQQMYAASIAENDAGSVNTPLLQVVAVDADENDTVIYSIESTNSSTGSALVQASPFYINRSSGQIFPNRTLDFESVRLYQLVVRATSSRNASRYHRALVTVRVKDVNDNAPVFSQPEYVFRVNEVREGLQRIGTVTATDRDSGRNGNILYSLVNTMTFSITKNSRGQGEISSLSFLSLDHENQSVYNFVVFALDGGNPSLSSSALVQVIIEDLNDNGPQFISVPKTPVEVPTDVQVGYTVLQLSVHDPDTPQNSLAVFELSATAASAAQSATILTYFALRDLTNSSARIAVKSSLRNLGNTTFYLLVKASDPGAVGIAQSEAAITIRTLSFTNPAGQSSSTLSTSILIVIILVAVALVFFLATLLAIKFNLRRRKRVFELQAKLDQTSAGLSKSRENVLDNPLAHGGSYKVRPESLPVENKSLESLASTPMDASDADQPYSGGNFPELATSQDGPAGTPLALREVTTSKGRSRSVIYSATMGELDIELASPMDSEDRGASGWNRKASTRTVETNLGGSSRATTPSSDSTSRSGSAYFPGHVGSSENVTTAANLARAQSQSEYSLSQSRPQTLISDYKRKKQPAPANGSTHGSPRKQVTPQKAHPPRSGGVRHSPHQLEAARSMYGSTPGSISGCSTPNSLASADDLGTRTWSPHRRPTVERHHSISRDNPASARVPVKRHISFSARYPEMQV